MKEFYQMLVEEFSSKLEHNYSDYCEIASVEKNLKTFLRYLIDNNLLNQSDIRKYTIVEEFQELLSTQQINKTNAIQILSKKFNISDRSIWSMVRRGRKKSNEN